MSKDKIIDEMRLTTAFLAAAMDAKNALDASSIKTIFDITRCSIKKWLDELSGETKEKEIEEIPETSIDNLGLTRRTVNSLKTEDIYTIQQLKQQTCYDLLRIPNIGRRSACEICTVMYEKYRFKIPYI